MKKQFLSLLALILGIGMVQANPVSESQAKLVGQQFVQANFDLSRQAGELTLVYTGVSTRGEACFYVYNVGNEGFVMVSADDVYRPIVGFSDEGAFDAQNINSELNYMLNELISYRSRQLTGEPSPAVAAEWKQVTERGKQLSFNGGRGNTYLCSTRWNQDYPYNYYCPEMSGGPGGHVYAGCVACAMSQVMKYWNHPLQGTGSHTYTSHGPGYPTIPNISANFGETTYDWANMPNSINSNSPQEQIDAVATLMFHCGVSVDMMYAIDGSGAYSDDVPQSIAQYFSYSNQAVKRNRDSFQYDAWANMLKESFDMGWPVYYSGQSSDGGHAFVCDGYNDANLYHYNWGWGGSGDGWFDFDLIDYNSSDGAIFNFVPALVYKETAKAPLNLNVTPAPNNALSATVTWTNPTQTLDNTTLSGIDQIVVCRDGEIIYTEDNVAPGAAMTYVDNEVPRFDGFMYTVYAVCNGNHGKVAYSDIVSFGPTCGWTVNITQASFTGFRGGAIHVYNAAGTEVASVTTTTSSVQSIAVDVPLGHVYFGWSAPTGAAFNMAFTIKDAQNNSVYTYSGSSDDMTEGIFHQQNNSCGNQTGTGVPSNLIAVRDDEDPYTIHVSWDGVGDSGYGYIVYRDGLLHRLIPEGTSFDDMNAPIGGHCYRVGFLSDGGENPGFSNESCATSGACYPPTNIDYETTGSTFKIKLKWEKPVPAEGLSGYYLFRATEVDGDYQRIKLLGANATSYTDNSANQEGHYYYKLYAAYQDLDCESAPASWIYDHNQFYLHVYYSPTGVEELEDSQIAVYPNPTSARFTIEAADMNHVSVFNTLGQMVYEANCEGDSVEINLNNVETGIYMVRVATQKGMVTKRITVIK